MSHGPAVHPISLPALGAVIQAAPDALFLLNGAGEILELSAAAEGLFGVQRDAVIGRLIADCGFSPVCNASHRCSICDPRSVSHLGGRVHRIETAGRRSDGTQFAAEWSLNGVSGAEPKLWVLTVKDRSEILLEKQLTQRQAEVLEMIASGAKLNEILGRVVTLLEEQPGSAMAAIMLADSLGRTLRAGASLALPAEFVETLNAVQIGPGSSPCATAAFRGERVLIGDIANDPLWKEGRDKALAHGLLACWSSPIFSAENEVIGTVCMYYREPRLPTRREFELVAIATHLAGIAIGRWRAERREHESTRFEGALAGAKLGLWDWDVESGEVVFDARWAELIGYDLAELEPHVRSWEERVHPEDWPRVNATVQAHLAGHTPVYRCEFRLQSKSGDWKWILASGTVVRRGAGGRPLRMRGTHLDLTERKQAEHALAKSEAKWRSLVENSPFLIFTFNREGCIILVNQAIPQQDRENGIRGNIYEYFRAEDLPQLRNAVADMFRTGELQRLEVGGKERDGALHWYASTVGPLERSDEVTEGVLICIDITERREAEARIERLNRLYTVLNNINEAIVRIRDPQPLYQEVCRIVVEQGLLKMAWVGLLDEKTGSLRPGPYWGANEGYLDLISISAHDVPQGRGPAGRALRSGRYAVTNDIANDSGFMARKEAHERGFLSCAAFPLKLGTRVIGVMTLYAGQLGFFKEEEVQLLNSLAEDLSFALESAEKEVQRRRAEEELIRIKMAVENATDAIGIINLQGESLYHNGALIQALGYSVEQLNALGGIATVAVNRTLARHALAEAEAGRSWTGDIEFYNIEGKVVELFLRADDVKDSEGYVVALIVVFTDISERKRAAAKIAEQAALLDKAQDAIIVRDLNDIIVYWNQGAQRLYGWTAVEAMGRRTTDLIRRDGDEMQDARETLLSRGEWSGEIPHRAKDGRDLVVEARWTLVLNEKGQPHSILAINTDVTEKRMLASQFFRAQRMESIGTLAGGIAHDLNNVLSPILMSLGVLRLKLTNESDQEMLDTVETSAKRGAEMVRQILTFARGIDGDRLPLLPKQLLQDLQRIVRDTFPKRIEFRLHVLGEVWMILGDPTQLHQVMLNLCVNARDAMPDGGTLTLSAENLEIDAHYARMMHDAKPGKYVLLQVTDTGTGVPDNIRERIFEPFFTTKETGQGTGLGLSTTLAIVKSHGGFIHVDSTVGHGTTFKVYLPAEITRKPDVPEPAAQPERGEGELVLLVDDEAPVRRIMQHTLEKFGYRVLTAENGAEALAVYVQHPGEIALVLTDMMMPIMDGPSTAQALLRVDPNAKIVGASGMATEAHIAKATAAGIKHFLSKPYSAETMLKIFREVLSGPKKE